jgi:hypothetical protein
VARSRSPRMECELQEPFLSYSFYESMNQECQPTTLAFVKSR